MLYLFTYAGVQHDFHIRLCLCCLTATRRISHVEEELLTIPKHTSSHPIFSGVLVARSLVFCVIICRSLFVRLSFLFQASVLSFFDLRLLINPLISANCWQLSCLEPLVLSIEALATQLLVKGNVQIYQCPFYNLYNHIWTLFELPGIYFISHSMP